MKNKKLLISLSLLVFGAIGLGLSSGINVGEELLANLQSLRSTFHYSSYAEPEVETSQAKKSPYLIDALRMFGNVKNEAGLIETYGGDIRVEEADMKMGSQLVNNLIFAAMRYRQNPALSSFLPVHSGTMATAKTWSAFLTPAFPDLYQKEHVKADIYLSGAEITESLAHIFFKNQNNVLEMMVRLGVITETEKSKWGDQRKKGILLADAVGLARSMIEMLERTAMMDLVAYSKDHLVHLSSMDLKVDDQSVSVLIRALMNERGKAMVENKTMKKYQKDMSSHYGKVLTSAHVRELRDRLNRSQVSAVMVPGSNYNLGNCNNALLEKMTLGPYFETGPIGLEIRCTLQLSKRERGELIVYIPPETTVVNMHGMPSVISLKSREERNGGFHLQFPQDLSNTLLIGPRGEESMTMRYVSQDTKRKDAKLGVHLLDENNVNFMTLLAEYQDGKKAEVKVNPRRIGHHQFTIFLDPEVL